MKVVIFILSVYKPPTNDRDWDSLLMVKVGRGCYTPITQILRNIWNIWCVTTGIRSGFYIYRPDYAQSLRRINLIRHNFDA